MDGIFPFSRASTMLDLVVILTVIILPVQFWSVQVAKSGRWQQHRLIQIISSVVLLIAVIGFEIDIRFNGWRHLAEASAYYDTLVFPVLCFHLAFAICTPFVWAYTLIKAMKQFGSQVQVNDYLDRHKRWGIVSLSLLLMTCLSGWVFYALAFVF